VRADRGTPAWRPSLGAWREGENTRFRVWAPTKQRVEVVLRTPGRTGAGCVLDRAADGSFGGVVPGIGPGDLYGYRLDHEGVYPDPAARFQPEGVHGPSQVVDASRFVWTDHQWRGVRLRDLVLYELHVGTFTPAGTFTGVRERLPYLCDLGVTAIELMPVADFPGQRNWGYDGVCLFAPARCYGTPDELRRLVDQAHRLGIGVLLDVVYNHLGPDGAYLATFSPYYFSSRHQTPWGDAVNLDGLHCEMVRAFFIENALHWLHEYHFDGLRLDATHALVDDSPRHFLAELCSRVQASVTERSVLLIAEDHRNLACMVRPDTAGGWGLDAVWADDFHHQVRRHLAGDHEGYYRDYTGGVVDVATTLRRGWFFCGQTSVHLNARRGTDPTGLEPSQFIICLQNHDQVGNRALGERLHQQIAPAAYRAATVLLLCAPETPLLFMGQEWAASSPFRYFTDHNAELGRLVTAGRRREFAAFSAFADPAARASIPDPQDPRTFQSSCLDWTEQAREPHASVTRLYRRLLALRRSEPALQAASWNNVAVVPRGDDALLLHRTAGTAALLVMVKLRSGGPVPLARPSIPRGPEVAGEDAWRPLLTTEDSGLSPDPTPIRLEFVAGSPTAYFDRPGALIMRVPSHYRPE
jgi:maltooligosyltrehalose trehalohydrolase